MWPTLADACSIFGKLLANVGRHWHTHKSRLPGQLSAGSFCAGRREGGAARPVQARQQPQVAHPRVRRPSGQARRRCLAGGRTKSTEARWGGAALRARKAASAAVSTAASDRSAALLASAQFLPKRCMIKLSTRMWGGASPSNIATHILVIGAALLAHRSGSMGRCASGRSGRSASCRHARSWSAIARAIHISILVVASYLGGPCFCSKGAEPHPPCFGAPHSL